VRYYIAYKYSNHGNKEELKNKLESISQKLASWGHQTFVLGRDVKKWHHQHEHMGSFRLVPVIFHNMRRCDAVLAYIDSPAFSKGLLFEAVIAKILRKDTILINESDNGKKLFNLFFNKIHHVTNLQQLDQKILE